MSFGKRYFGLETDHGATALAAAALLKAAVLAVAVAFLIYPAIPASYLWAKASWGDTLYMVRGLDVLLPFNLLWALEGFRNVNVVARGLLALALAFSVFAPPPKPDQGNDESEVKEDADDLQQGSQLSSVGRRKAGRDKKENENGRDRPRLKDSPVPWRAPKPGPGEHVHRQQRHGQQCSVCQRDQRPGPNRPIYATDDEKLFGGPGDPVNRQRS